MRCYWAFAVKYIERTRGAAEQTVTVLVACGVKTNAIQPEVPIAKRAAGMPGAIAVRSCGVFRATE